MNTIGFSDLRRLTVAELESKMPLTVNVNGEPVWLLGKIPETMLIGDLHPRVRKQFKTIEQRVRRGMPKGEEIRVVPLRDRPSEIVGVPPAEVV